MFYNKKQLHTVKKKVVNFYIVYEITNFHDMDNYPTLTDALFGAVTLTKNADIDKYKYFGYGIGFDRKGFYSHPSGGTGRNIIIFGVDMHTEVINFKQQFKDVQKILHLLKISFFVKCEAKRFDLDFLRFSIFLNVFREDSSMNAFVFLPNDSVQYSK